MKYKNFNASKIEEFYENKKQDNEIKTKVFKYIGTYRNKKNGNLYEVYNINIIEATNGIENQIKVLYTDGINMFVREISEFNEKFEVWEINND